MFTGIIETIGRITVLESVEGGFQISIHANHLKAMPQGASIAVNGVCLTVTGWQGQIFSADISCETRRLTTWSRLQVGDQVNLESCLTPASLLGGHLVSGHVDGIGEVVTQIIEGQSTFVTLQLPRKLMPYMTVKGSICLDGVSLTLTQVADNTVTVCLIPHTIKHTILQYWRPGDQVNVEIDMLARYVAHWALPATQYEGRPLAMEERDETV